MRLRDTAFLKNAVDNETRRFLLIGRLGSLFLESFQHDLAPIYLFARYDGDHHPKFQIGACLERTG
ncbi:hypothetical protein OROHE_025041 [Orobanche hederae]